MVLSKDVDVIPIFINNVILTTQRKFYRSVCYGCAHDGIYYREACISSLYIQQIEAKIILSKLEANVGIILVGFRQQLSPVRDRLAESNI